jgi:integrase
MIKRDLARAGIDYVDDHGRYADFHALRHTFISSLAKAGVHPLKAKELARHSTITLTMDVYSHVETDELRDALGSVPFID